MSWSPCRESTIIERHSSPVHTARNGRKTDQLSWPSVVSSPSAVQNDRALTVGHLCLEHLNPIRG
jgi:hypothetical protein